MTAVYDGQENGICDMVAKVVSSYYPAGEHGSEDKGEADTKQTEILMQKTE